MKFVDEALITVEAGKAEQDALASVVKNTFQRRARWW